MFCALNHKHRDCFAHLCLSAESFFVDRAISLRDTTEFITVTLRLFHKFIISLLFHSRGGSSGDFAITLDSLQKAEHGAAVGARSWNILSEQEQKLICKFMSGWLEDLKRFSLCLNQKAIYL